MKKRNRVLSVTLALALCAGMLPAITPPAAADGYGSDGMFLDTIDPPIAGSTPISNREDLEKIANNLGGKYHLTNNIDLSGAEWAPIGDNSTNSNTSRFSGVFDGQGHVISNLKITGDVQYAGLFGYASEAVIRNVSLEKTYINIEGTAYLYAGGICGYLASSHSDYGCFISNCSNTGFVSASSNSNSPSVFSSVGGICGSSWFSTIRNCRNTGSVSASAVSAYVSARAGGICGYSRYSSSISDCLNTGSVSASTVSDISHAGGICGILDSGHISNCYNTGSVSASYAGGICGSCSGRISNSYWNIDSAQMADGNPAKVKKGVGYVGYGTDGTTSLTTAQMKVAANFVGFDFYTVWAIDPSVNNGYPYLRDVTAVDGGDDPPFQPSDVIVSHDGGYTIFPHPLDWYISNTTSTNYSQKLSEIAMALSWAAYDPDDIEQSLSSNGFTDIKPYLYSDLTDGLAYTISQKKTSTGNTVVAVVLRGTVGVNEWISDANIALTNGLYGNHAGFNNAMTLVFGSLKDYLGRLPSGGSVKYFITGHSRGAAAANLLAVELADKGVKQEDVYAYTYATPDVGVQNPASWNGGGSKDNIFNICNRYDPVTLLPGSLFSTVTLPGTQWGKYGRTYWFSEGDGFNISAHYQIKYLNFVKHSNTPGNSRDFSDDIIDGWNMFGGLLTTIKCPVDVEIVDGANKTIAKITNNEPNYETAVFGDVIMMAMGNMKSIFLRGDSGYRIVLTATGDGKMNYSVRDFNILSNEPSVVKSFENVPLIEDKQMESSIGGTVETPDIQLFVTDGDEIISEVQGVVSFPTYRVEYYQDSLIKPVCTKYIWETYSQGHRLTPAEVKADMEKKVAGSWLDYKKPSTHGVALVSYPTLSDAPAKNAVKVLYMERR